MDSLSQNSLGSGCFMVKNSQEDDKTDHQQLYKNLFALRTVKADFESNNNDDEGLVSPTLTPTKKANGYGSGYSLKAMAGSGDEGKAEQPVKGQSSASHRDTAQSGREQIQGQGSGGAGESGGAGSGGGPGGGGGGGPGRGGAGDEGADPPHEQDDEEETPSSAGSGYESADVSTLGRPPSNGASSRGPPGRGDSSESEAPPFDTTVSEGEGGISDALTAVVSDTEGHGQVIESRAVVRAREEGLFRAPGGRGSPRLRGASPRGDVSSVASSLSSYSSSSSDDKTSDERSPRPQRKRPVGKKPRQEIPSESDTKTTSSDTSAEKLHDTSGERTDADALPLRRDLFGEGIDSWEKKRPDGAAPSKASTSGAAYVTDRTSSSSSSTLRTASGSLQQWQQPMTGLSDDGSVPTGEELVFGGSQESLNLQISESQPPPSMDVPGSDVECSLHLRMSPTQSTSGKGTQRLSQHDADPDNPAEPTVIPSSQEGDLVLHFTQSETMESQSVGVSQIVDRLDSPFQSESQSGSRVTRSRSSQKLSSKKPSLVKGSSKKSETPITIRKTRKAAAGQTLTLSMIDTQETQDTSEPSAPTFTVDRPTVGSAEDTESEPKSVFEKDRVRQQQLEQQEKEEQQAPVEEGEDPFTFTSQEDLKRQESWKSLHQTRFGEKRTLSPRAAVQGTSGKAEAGPDSDEQDSEVIITKRRRPSQRLEDEYEKDTEPEEVVGDSVEVLAVRDRSTLEGEEEEIVLSSEDQPREFTEIKQSTDRDAVSSPERDHTTQKHLREQVSVASSQGFQQQTSFELSGKSRNSPAVRDGGTESSDNGAHMQPENKSDQEEEMEVEEDIIPPSDNGDSRVSSLRRSVSGSRDSSQVQAVPHDPFQFTMSQSQRERDDLEKIKEQRKGKSQSRTQEEAIPGRKNTSEGEAQTGKSPSGPSPTVPRSAYTGAHFSADTQPTSQITPQTSHSRTQISRSSSGHAPDCFLSTTITTTIMKVVRTMKQEFRSGQCIHSQIDEVPEIIETTTETFVEDLSEPSPSRSGQTLSSGDLADISSSMSRSGTTSKSSSLVSPPISIVPGSSSGSSGPSLGSFSGAVATSTQGMQRPGESPISRSRGKSSSSSSSLEQRQPPLRTQSTLASKKRSKQRSQDVQQGLEMEGQPEVETVVDPHEQSKEKEKALVDTSMELLSGVDAPQMSKLQEEFAMERRESKEGDGLEEPNEYEERRRSSSLFSDAAEQKRVSASSGFSIPSRPPPRRSKTSPGAESRTSRRSSSLLNELYGLHELAAFKDIPSPDEATRGSSSVGSASLFSAGSSRPSNQSDRRSSSSVFSGRGYHSERRSSGSLFSDRRSSVSVQISGDEAGGAPEPALAVTTALTSQPDDESPPTPASKDDAQNVTVLPAGEQRKKGDSIGASPPQSKHLKRDSSSDSKHQPEQFAAPSIPAPAPTRTSSEGKTSSSSFAQSASLFTSPDQPAGDQESSKSKSTDSSMAAEIMLRKTLEPRQKMEEESEEMHVDEDPEIVPGTLEEEESATKIGKRGRSGKTPGRTAKKTAKSRGARAQSAAPKPGESATSGPVKLMKTSENPESSEVTEISGNDAPFRPPAEHTLNPGTPVHAKWRDRCLYPGKIVGKEGQRYVVTFEDGDSLKVKQGDVVVCDLLPVGCAVMAEDESGDYVAAVVTEASADGYEVELVEGKTKIRLQRGQVMLSVKAGQTMLTSTPVRIPTETVSTAPTTPAPATPAPFVLETTTPSDLTPVELKTPMTGHSARRGRGHIKRGASATPSAAKEQVKDRVTALRSERSESRSHLATPQKPETPSFTRVTTTSEAVSREVTFTESPEISAIASTSHDAEPFMSTPTTSIVEMGTPVLSMWKDKHFYPGHIASEEKDGKYVVRFEDGTRRQCKDTDIIVCDMLSDGQEVYAEKEDGAGTLATVISSRIEEDEKLYTVQYMDDETVSRVLRSQVSLSADQAESLARLGYLGPQTPSVGAADLSLEHLVEGKRSRKGTPKTPGTTPRKSKGTEEKKSEYASATKEPRKMLSSARGGVKRKLVGPQATSTPTPKRSRSALKEEDKEIVAKPGPSSVMVGVFESPPPARKRSPRKGKAKSTLFGVKGPLPPKGLFAGMVFLITYVEKTEEEKAYELSLRRRTSSSDVTSDDEEEFIPLDRDYLEEQIVAGGGRYLPTFDLDEVQAAQKKCFLLSDSHHRTMKYLNCLAAPVRCVSHVWIRDCCRLGRLEDPTSYMLPAGRDIESDKLVEWSNAESPLRDIHVCVTHSDGSFVHQWTSLLETAGCTLLAKPPRNTDPDKRYVVVSKLGLERNVLQRMSQLGVPIVSTEWIIQCLIRRVFVNTEGHPRYKHDYVHDE